MNEVLVAGAVLWFIATAIMLFVEGLKEDWRITLNILVAFGGIALFAYIQYLIQTKGSFTVVAIDLILMGVGAIAFLLYICKIEIDDALQRKKHQAELHAVAPAYSKLSDNEKTFVFMYSQNYCIVDYIDAYRRFLIDDKNMSTKEFVTMIEFVCQYTHSMRQRNTGYRAYMQVPAKVHKYLHDYPYNYFFANIYHYEADKYKKICSEMVKMDKKHCMKIKSLPQSNVSK